MENNKITKVYIELTKKNGEFDMNNFMHSLRFLKRGLILSEKIVNEFKKDNSLEIVSLPHDDNGRIFFNKEVVLRGNSGELTIA